MLLAIEKSQSGYSMHQDITPAKILLIMIAKIMTGTHVYHVFIMCHDRHFYDIWSLHI